MIKYGLFLARMQPLHKGHQHIRAQSIREDLEANKRFLHPLIYNYIKQQGAEYGCTITPKEF